MWILDWGRGDSILSWNRIFAGGMCSLISYLDYFSYSQPKRLHQTQAQHWIHGYLFFWGGDHMAIILNGPCVVECVESVE